MRKDLRLDLIGLRVGQLEIIKFVGINKNSHTIWKAKCNCGKFKNVIGKEFKRGKGGTKCNDCHTEEKRQRATQHGDYNTRFYKCWRSMINRCDNQSDFKKWTYYGGRGIKYDSNWIFYDNFKNDMYFKYIWAKRYYNMENLTLERIDVNKGYNFKNCCFILMKDQSKTRRNSMILFKAISPKGKEYVKRDKIGFAKQYLLSVSKIRECLGKKVKQHKGWTFEYLEPKL